MTRRTTVALCATTAIAIVVLVVVWVYPGYLASPNACPEHATDASRPFCAETVPLTQWCPNPGLFCQSPPGFTFNGVLFQIALVNHSGLASIYGQVTESNNTTYRFEMAPDPTGPPPAWVSSDGGVLIVWPPPFATTGANGLLNTNVTVGVSFALVNEG